MQSSLAPENKAYAKLTNFRGEQHYIRKLPCLITSRAYRAQVALKYKQHTLGITNNGCKGVEGILYYDGKENFRLISFVEVKVDGVDSHVCSSEVMNQLVGGGSEKFEKYEEHSQVLEDVSSIYFESSSDTPDLFYFTLPQDTIPKYDYKIPVIKTPTYVAKTNKQADNKIVNGASNTCRWTADDREQLKKLLLQYGYGRWKSLQRSSTLIGGKLENKSIQEIKAYTNSFVRSLGMSLPPEEKDLQTFLLSIIEQDPSQMYLPPNPKDWDYQIPLSQRSVQYTKRLQLLNRVKTLVRKYKEEAVKTTEKGQRVNWDGLLNFIPTNHLFGQRPSSWWAKKHDIDLILGVYKYGYANYSVIKSARQYCFAEFERAHNYQDFPSADNLTRRLKKLMQTIMRIEMNQGKIDFDDDGEESEPDKGWSDNEKRELFNLLVEMGTPLTADGRSNYMELRERMKVIIKDFDKTVGQLEKMAAKIKWTCQQLLTESIKIKEEEGNKFHITFEMATKFNKHLNMLGFIRKNILANEAELFNANLNDLKQKNEELKSGDPAFISESYDEATNDLLLLNWISKNGLTACSGQLRMSEVKTIARAQWLCEVFKIFKDKNNEKKKKIKENTKEQRRRTKFQLNRDKSGNIVFPLTINPSLKLVAIGKVCTLPSYHSEHNLFPIGFISIRTHASMITKGARAHYTCEILEGDGRPIYKVTPSQEPDQPIIKDSSTGCWVRICQRVNQLQDVRKEKVTISGTQRFGLLQHNVVRILEDLADSQKCLKYKFKYKQVEGRMLQE